MSLLVACQAGDAARVQELLDAGEDANAHTLGGTSALSVAACARHAHIVKVLLAAGADPNAVSPGSKTPLHYASSSGPVASVEALLEAGADVNAVDMSGYTPLMLACCGHAACIEVLLEAGADVHAANKLGDTALIVASDGGFTACVKALLASGALVNRPSLDGVTALMQASCSPSTACVETLLAAGAEVNAADGEGATAVLHACANGHLENVKLLSSHGAERITWKGRTPEALAALYGYADVAAWLQASRHWTTPLHHLEELDALRATSLLRGGANLHARAPANSAPTPLERARELRAAGAADGSPAHLVVRAAEPWAPPTWSDEAGDHEGNHELFPAVARARAAELWWARLLLSRQEGLGAVEQVLWEYTRRAIVRQMS